MPDIGSYLQPTAGAPILRDYQHASRLYLDNAYALAPKNGWIYYVVFDINTKAIVDSTWDNSQVIGEVGMLVKSSDLPKFVAETEVMNQYNRKSVIQKKINYQPVSMTLHDDQSNVVHNMWLNYFAYYSPDITYINNSNPSTGTVPIAFEKSNQYDGTNAIFQPFNFGLNSGLVDEPFFRSITIYQLNRQVFTSFQLINPIVSAWDHDRLDQTNTTHLAESKMTLAYDAVLYGVGQVSVDTPAGFATFHYDNTPSPLQVSGGAANNLSSQVFGTVKPVSNPFSTQSPLITAANVGLGVVGVPGQYPGTPLSVATVGAVGIAATLLGSNGLGITGGAGGLTSVMGGLSSLGSSAANVLGGLFGGTSGNGGATSAGTGIGNMNSAALAPNGTNADTAIPAGDSTGAATPAQPDDGSSGASQTSPDAGVIPNDGWGEG